jgi:DNA-binding XRE family transcriptional regulator
MVGARRDSNAALTTVPLAKDLFIELCAIKGAFNEQERADLMKVDRNTVNRWIKGKTSPLLPQARAAARTLESTVDALWPEGATS